MKLVVTSNAEQFNQRAALEVARQIDEKPDSVLGFATGNTTEGMHRELARLYGENLLDFSRVATFNLDEYAGAAKDNPASCYARMKTQLFDHVNLDAERIHFLDSMADDPEKECGRFEVRILEAGGIDLQVLGIGTNGHIAFNEPGTPFHSVSRVVDIPDLTVQTRAAMFGAAEKVPRKGLTIGIKNIMHARKIVLLAKGADKADIIRRSLCGPIGTDVPASVLQLHPSLTVILDQEAAGKLNESLLGLV